MAGPAELLYIWSWGNQRGRLNSLEVGVREGLTEAHEPGFKGWGGVPYMGRANHWQRCRSVVCLKHLKESGIQASGIQKAPHPSVLTLFLTLTSSLTSPAPISMVQPHQPAACFWNTLPWFLPSGFVPATCPAWSSLSQDLNLSHYADLT